MFQHTGRAIGNYTVYAIENRRVYFGQVQGHLNCVVFWLRVIALIWYGFKNSVQDDLHIGMENGHDLNLHGLMNINEHDVIYKHIQ